MISYAPFYKLRREILVRRWCFERVFRLGDFLGSWKFGVGLCRLFGQLFGLKDGHWSEALGHGGAFRVALGSLRGQRRDSSDERGPLSRFSRI